MLLRSTIQFVCSIGCWAQAQTKLVFEIWLEKVSIKSWNSEKAFAGSHYFPKKRNISVKKFSIQICFRKYPFDNKSVILTFCGCLPTSQFVIKHSMVPVAGRDLFYSSSKQKVE